jgi:urease accessory protein
LQLRFFRGAGATPPTRLAVQEQQPPLRVIRAFPQPGGGVLTHLHNVSGGVLGGDQLTVLAHLEESTQVQLTSTGATRIYRHRPDYGVATQATHLRLDSGALLEYLPDPLIPFAAARFRQQTTIELADDAGLFYWEVLAPGREAHNERFAYTEVQVQLDIWAAGAPIVIERLRLTPGERPLTSLARLADYRYVGAFYICKVGLDPAQWLTLEGELMALAQALTMPGEILWGVSTMPAHGLTVRALSMTNRTITNGLLQFWDRAKRALYGVAAVPPRKVY